MRRVRTGFGSIAILLMLSSFWIETDAYRFGAVTLVIVAVSSWFMGEFRPRAGWGEALCLGWCLIVLARFAIAKLSGVRGFGSAEGLYLFPLFFPLLGYAFFLLRGQIDRIIWVFFIAALVMLAATTDFPDILAGQRVEVLVFNNPIHGSCAAGLLAIAAMFWIEHLLSGPDLGRPFRAAGIALALTVIGLALPNIYGGHSKGVWLATLVTLPALFIALARLRWSWRLAVPAAAALALLAVIAAVAATDVWSVASPTARPGIAIALAVARTGSLGRVHDALAGGTLPTGLSERLMIWFDGWQIWSSAFWFGPGLWWAPMLKETRYHSQVDYNIFHNGYLEVAVRYGVFGLLVFAAIYANCVAAVVRARRAALIAPAALHLYLCGLLFFAVTLLSNSNNRLSIGETMILLTGSFAFACRYAMQLAAQPAFVQALHAPIDYAERR